MAGSLERLNVAGEVIGLDDALRVVSEYALGCRPLIWKPPPAGAECDRPRATSVGKFAYRTYDCIPADSTPGLTGVDLFIAAGLNGNVNAAAIASLLAVEPALSEALAAIPALRVSAGLGSE